MRGCYRFQRPGNGIGRVLAPAGAAGTLGRPNTVFLKLAAGFGGGAFGAGGFAGGGAADFGTRPCATSASVDSKSRAARMRAS